MNSVPCLGIEPRSQSKMNLSTAHSIEGQDLPPVVFTGPELKIFKPREDLTVSQWAAKHRVVTKGSHRGQWDNDLVPYLAPVMDAFNLPYVRTVIMCFAPQTGKTNAALNMLAYAIDQDPGPAMYIMPEEKTAKRISRRRIIPMFRETPRVADLLSPRADDTSTLAVNFTNGMDLMMAWAGSAAMMASESVRYLFFDETDKYPDYTGKEADPISLGEVRTTTFPHTKKIVYLSTPTIETGVITMAMEKEADVVYHYQVPCPFCGHMQEMGFESIHWPGGSKADHRRIRRQKLARYSCTKCKMDWDDYTKDKAVKAGKWVPDKEIERPEAVAFYLPSWYSPAVSLSDPSAAFLKGLEDPAKMMAFVTQHQAKAWKEVIEPKQESQLLENNRTDNPPMIVPEACLALTCGIDVQKKGFWFTVRAWEKDFTNHLIYYGYLSTFEDVENLVFKTSFQRADGKEPMEIWRAAMDTGGGKSDEEEWSRTEEIYMWLRAMYRKYGPVATNRLFGIKGASRPQLNRVRARVIDKMVNKNRVIPGGLEIRFLDTAQFKDIIHWRMGRRGPQEGDNGEPIPAESQRFLLHKETGMDYALQVLAEEKRRNRRKKIEWVQIRRDNHLLDGEVYAAACADSEWLPSLQMIMQLQLQEQPKKEEKPKPTDKGPDWITGNRGRSSWINRN